MVWASEAERKRNLQKLAIVCSYSFSWGIALLEYSFMIPANKMGFKDNGG